DFKDWQNEFLPVHGFRLTESTLSGTISDALEKLLPRTAPISTRYLFWPLNEEWTLYFDNARLGTDASPPSVLASRLHTDAMRISMADELVESVTGKPSQYGSTIFEYYEDAVALRYVFAVNDGGKWRFGQGGTPFHFEKNEMYKSCFARKRLTASVLLQYLSELNASLDGSRESPFEHGPGVLLVKSGKMPRDYQEFHE
ncbi:hypothetical protein, partial [Undibacterium sp.]|uniref:hypothetical protein n=1 Tax=Undibacterium sp. TaxID=1914977 RepID=UPI00374CD955